MKTVSALDDIRPPEKTLVHSYRRETESGWTTINLDKPKPISKIPDNGIVEVQTPSLERQNETVNFVIVQHAYNDISAKPIWHGTNVDSKGHGIVRVLAPEFSVKDNNLEPDVRDADFFETWESTEDYIANNFDQPSKNKEIIRPLPACTFSEQVQSFLMSLNTGFSDTKIYAKLFHRYTPLDDEFFQTNQ